MLTQNMTDFTGQQIGPYQVEALLTSRSVSNLHVARDVKLDQPVFLEVLQVTAEQDPDLASRFQRRMELVSQLKHQQIPPVLEVGVTADGFPYAVIEYVAGETLDQKLADWREGDNLPSIESSLLLARQIAEILSIAHPAGLIHHDLRPENIIIRDSDGKPVLIDLGVPVQPNARNGVLTDTSTEMLDYASPEEQEGKGISRRSNIYSLGIILYELLTGHRPYLPTSSWDIFERSTMPKEVPLEEAREGLSGETYRLVRNCLWRQEWSRFENADELLSAIDTAILAEQSLPKTTIWSQERRRWLYVAIPLVALLVLIVGLAAVWSQFISAQGEQDDPVVAVVNETPAGGEEETPVGAATSEGVLAGGGVDSGATATPTEAAPPTSPAQSVGLAGPAASSAFTRQEEVSLAWFWLTLPKDDEHFAVYIAPEAEGGDALLVGTVREPDNASLYLLNTSAADLGIDAGDYLWQVRLEKIDSGEAVALSEPRPITFVPDPTATSVPATSTGTATATPSPTITSTPTPTATAECVPFRPSGWVEYTIQRGDSPASLVEDAGVPVDFFLTANCLPRNAVLSIGQVVYAPPPPATPTFTPRPAVPTSPPPPPGGGGGNGGGGNNGGGGSEEPTAEPTSPTPLPAPTSTPLPPP